MPRYHFHFLGGEDDGIDDVGVEFANLDLAYLDAHRTMIRIGAEMLIDQQDPSSLCIEIADASGLSLMTLPFDEVFARRVPGRSPTLAPTPAQRFRAQLERSRRLGEEIQAACADARAYVAAAKLTLASSQRRMQKAAEQGW